MLLTRQEILGNIAGSHAVKIIEKVVSSWGPHLIITVLSTEELPLLRELCGSL